MNSHRGGLTLALFSETKAYFSPKSKPPKIGLACFTHAFKTIDVEQTFDALSGTQKINQSND